MERKLSRRRHWRHRTRLLYIDYTFIREKGSGTEFTRKRQWVGVKWRHIFMIRISDPNLGRSEKYRRNGECLSATSSQGSHRTLLRRDHYLGCKKDVSPITGQHVSNAKDATKTNGSLVSKSWTSRSFKNLGWLSCHSIFVDETSVTE